jgi:hypothetical protein
MTVLPRYRIALVFPFGVTPFTSFRASSERSEGSVVMGSEMLRCAQHDMALTHTNAWINLLICIISVQLASHEVVQ